MKRIVLALIGLVVGCAAAIAETADGIWALSVANCTEISSPSVMTVNTQKALVSFYESECAIISSEAIGDQGLAWRVGLSCSGEGETWIRDTIYALDLPFDGGPERLVEIDMTDGFVIGRYRCR